MPRYGVECPHPECPNQEPDHERMSKHYYNAHGESYVDALAVIESGILPEEYYDREYNEKGRTLKEIAADLGVSYTSVMRRMDAYELPRRGRGESKSPPGVPDTPGPVERLRDERRGSNADS